MTAPLAALAPTTVTLTNGTKVTLPGLTATTQFDFSVFAPRRLFSWPVRGDKAGTSKRAACPLTDFPASVSCLGAHISAHIAHHGGIPSCRSFA